MLIDQQVPEGVILPRFFEGVEMKNFGEQVRLGFGGVLFPQQLHFPELAPFNLLLTVIDGILVGFASEDVRFHLPDLIIADILLPVLQPNFQLLPEK